MKHAWAVAGVVVVLAGIVVHPQAPSSNRPPVGRGSTGGFQGRGGQVTGETATLTFNPGGDSPAYTIDFITRFDNQQPAPPPRPVDIIVTQYPAADETPALTMRVDGQPMSLASRLYSRRSVAATISLDEFVRLTSARAIVERAFDTDLELDPGQIGMLRRAAAQWTERVRR